MEAPITLHQPPLNYKGAVLRWNLLGPVLGHDGQVWELLVRSCLDCIAERLVLFSCSHLSLSRRLIAPSSGGVGYASSGFVQGSSIQVTVELVQQPGYFALRFQPAEHQHLLHAHRFLTVTLTGSVSYNLLRGQ